eukprot:1198046-Lingulodinium_polyedra.AAC.1
MQNAQGTSHGSSEVRRGRPTLDGQGRRDVVVPSDGRGHHDGSLLTSTRGRSTPREQAIPNFTWI